MKDFTGRYKKSKKFYPLYKRGKFSLPLFLKEGGGWIFLKDNNPSCISLYKREKLL